MKNGKSNFGVSFHKNIANFEAFWGVKNFSKNLLFLRNVFYTKLEKLSKIFQNLTKKGLKPCGLLKLHFYQILEHCQPGGFLLLSKKGSKEAEN